MSISGKITLIRRWIGILTGKNRVAVKQGVGKLYKKTEIAGYYNDLTGKVNSKTLLDGNGVTVNLIEGNKTVYFPISIFQYALGLWDLFLDEKDDSLKERFLTQCEWIVENQNDDGSWNCFGPIGYKELTVSSMGQGEAISALLRAYVLTKEQKWIDAARKAMAFMLIPVEEGGTLLVEKGEYYLEEYPDLKGTKRSVLNGWIFTLFGLYDYLQIIPDEQVECVYQKSIMTLKMHLKDYDLGYWSYYDKTGRVASPAYHDLHISLLNVLADLTGEIYFSQIADSWDQYANKSVNLIKAIIKKAIQKLKESPEGIIIQ